SRAPASTWFAGAELNYRAGLLATEDARLDLLAGYRFAYLEDELYLGEQPADGQTLFKRNRLTAEDTFHGGQLGLAGEWRTQTWYTQGGGEGGDGGGGAGAGPAGGVLPSQPARPVPAPTR